MSNTNDLYHDMPELQDTSGIDIKGYAMTLSIIKGEYTPLNTVSVKCRNLLCDIAANIWQHSQNQEERSYCFSFIYPSLLRRYEESREFCKFLLCRGYLFYAEQLGKEAECWDFSLFIEVFTEFMLSDASVENNTQLLEKLFELGITDPINLDFYDVDRRREVSTLYTKWNRHRIISKDITKWLSNFSL